MDIQTSIDMMTYIVSYCAPLCFVFWFVDMAVTTIIRAATGGKVSFRA